jgi:membrane protein implicated in regulation of membrane protease activity
METRPQQQPACRTLRLLGWIVAGCLALAGNLIGPSPVALWLELAGAAVFAVGTVRPSALRPIYAVVMFGLWPLVRLSGWFVKTSRSRQGRQVANSGA